MVALLFLICMPSGQCISVTHEQIYPTEEMCQVAGLVALEDGQKDVAQGLVPPHSAIFKCVAWGDPT